MVRRMWHKLLGCHTVSYAPGPLHKLLWFMGAISAMCNPRADLMLDCTQGECQPCEKGNKGMVRVCKERSLFLVWINSYNEVNKLTSDSFLQSVFQRQKSNGAVCVCWDRAIWEEKFCVGLWGEHGVTSPLVAVILYIATYKGTASRDCELNRSNSF